MTLFVSDNPVIMSGTIIAKRNEKVVLGDGQGNTLTFVWTADNAIRVHGSPSDVIVDLPLGVGEVRTCACVPVHFEGRPVQVRYVVEPVDEQLCLISYTLCEDMRELLLEAEAPALAHRDLSEGVRIGMGPDGS